MLDPSELFAGSDATIEEAVSAVEDLWNNQLRYRFDAAHNWTTDPTGPRLVFITQIGPGGFYETGSAQIRSMLAS